MAKVTEKQKLFVDAYLADPEMNAARAYLKVYTSVKSLSVAAVNASRLLTKPHVQDYLRERMKDREKRTEITQDRVLQELAKAAFADIKDYLSFRTAKTVIDRDENGEPVIDYQPVIDMLSSDEVDGSVINQISLTDKGTLSFKLQDKLKALELLGRHLGMFTDKLDVNLPITVVIEDDYGDDDDNQADN